MNDSQALQQSLKLLKQKYETENKNDPNAIKINQLITQLDQLVIDFIRDIDLYNLSKDRVEAKISNFSEELDLSKNIYVENVSMKNNSDFLGCYKNNNKMTFTGNMNFERCRMNAFDLQKPYFSLQHEDGANACYVGNNLYDIIEKGPQYNFIPIWQSKDNINTKSNKQSHTLKVFYTSFAIIDGNNKIIYSNDIETAKKEIKIMKERKDKGVEGFTNIEGFFKRHQKRMRKAVKKAVQQARRAKQAQNQKAPKGSFNIKVGNSSQNTKIINLPADNLEVSPQPVNPQGRGWGDRFSTKVVGRQLYVTRTDYGGGWGQQLVLKATSKAPKPTAKISNAPGGGVVDKRDDIILALINKDKDKEKPVEMPTSRLEITDNGNFILRSEDKIIWKANSNNNDSEVVEEWIPVNNPTNKYKRAYLKTGESLDSKETISSNNGRYKLEFINDSLRMFAAEFACVGKNKVGNTETTGLHIIDKSRYDIKNDVGSSGKGVSKFNITMGECMLDCDRDKECVGAEYKMDKTSTCTIKKDMGTNYKEKGTTIMSKTFENILDDRIYLDNIGYIDKQDNLNVYPKSMLEYSDFIYKAYKNTTTGGKVINKMNGTLEDAIIECNKLSNCAGFLYNPSTNAIELKDSSIYPASNKQFDNSVDLYKRGFTINVHKSCNTTYDAVNADLWKNYEARNKIRNVDPKTHKCGVIKHVDIDLEELKTIYKRLNEHTKTVQNIFQSLSDLNVKISDDVKSIQNEMSQSVTTAESSNKNLENKKGNLNKEGFTNFPFYKNIECCRNDNILVQKIDTTTLSISLIALFIGGLFLYSRK